MLNARRTTLLAVLGLALVLAPAILTAQSVEFLGADGSPASVYLESSTIFVRVDDPGADLSPTASETVQVSLSSLLGGDSESLSLQETDLATGVFEGSIALALGSPATSDNGVLETWESPGPPASFDTLAADYQGGLASAGASTLGSRIFFINPQGIVVTAYATGSTAHVRVEDQNFNNPSFVDSLSLSLGSLVGDLEDLTLEEIDGASGIFEGTIELEDSTFPISFDGVLQAQIGGQVSAMHSDYLGNTTSEAWADILIASIEFLDADGIPTTLVLEAGEARLRVTSTTDDLNPYAAESLLIDLATTNAGDLESLAVTETGNSTGIFEGSIRLSGPAGSGMGFLDTYINPPTTTSEEITATYGGVQSIAATVGSQVEFLDEFGRVTGIVVQGGTVYLRVRDQNRNDPQVYDAVSIDLTTSDGDAEILTLQETSYDSGVFLGLMPLAATLIPGDGSLSVVSPGTVDAAYTQIDALVSTAQATVVDSAIWFLDADGNLASTYLEGSEVIVRVRDVWADTTASPDTVAVDLSSQTGGDLETLLLTETGDSTGVFEGEMDLENLSETFNVTQSDNRLQTVRTSASPARYDTVAAQYFDSTSSLASTTFARMIGSRTWFVDDSGATVTTFAIGGAVHVRVEDQNYNYPMGFDYVDVEIRSLTSNDSEILMLQEIDRSSGIFEGSIDLADGGGSSLPSDGVLQAVADEVIEAFHPDSNASVEGSLAQATVQNISLEIVDASGAPTATVVQSDTLHVRVRSIFDDIDSGNADTIQVDASTLYGADLESFILTETGPSTGVFEGSIRLAGSAGSGPGFLETATSGLPLDLPDQITATYNGASDQATVIGSRIWLLDEFGRFVASYALGETVTVRVLDQNRNDPQTYDTINVQLNVQGSASDSESLVLSEVGYDSGIFEGSIPLSSLGTSLGDGLLYGEAGDLVTATHTNIAATTIAANASLNGAAVWWIDASGDLAETFLEGGRAYVRVLDPFANGSPSSIDSVGIALSAFLAGDSEFLMLVETGEDSGVFEGSIELQTDQYGSASSGNNILETGESQGPPFEYDTLTATYFGSDPNVQPTATAQTTGSRTWLVDANGAITTSYAVGGKVYVRVEDQNSNYEQGFDYVDVELRSLTSNDSEILMLQEIDRASGIFEGSIDLVDGGGSSLPSDGVLQATADETIEVVHNDMLGYSQSFAQATVSFVSLEIVDASGAPTATVVQSDTLHVRVRSIFDDIDSGNADTIQVDASTLYGADLESFSLTETGPSTGVFEGSIRLAGSAGSGPGFLETATSGPPLDLPDQITATYNGASDQATVIGSRIWLLDEFGRFVSSYALGETVSVRVLDQNRNDPQTYDTINVQLNVQGSASDSESLVLSEVGYDSGIFEGSIPLSSLGTSPGDGLLYGEAGDLVTATHTNIDATAIAANASLSGAAVWWIDAQGDLAETFLEGGRAYVRVLDPFANGSPSSIDSVGIALSAFLTGDSESLMLVETGEDSGVFEGSIELQTDQYGSASSGNNILETGESQGPPFEYDTLTAIYFGSDPSVQPTATAQTTGSRIWLVDANGAIATSYAVGGKVYVRVEDQNSNYEQGFDYVDVEIRSLTSNDSEILMLQEIDRSSGIFEGSIDLADGGGSSLPSDGVLQATADETIEVIHNDMLGYSQSFAQATVSFVSLEILDASGAPTTTVVQSDTLHVRVRSIFDDLDSGSADTILVDASTLYGADLESFSLTETGPSTGVFEGSIRLAGSAGSGPGFLETATSGPPLDLPDQITATYNGASDQATVIGSRIWLLDEFGRFVASYALGETVTVRVLDRNRNDPQTYDTINVQLNVQGSASDSESLMLSEVGYDSGIFEGSIPLSSLGTSPGDGLLYGEAGDLVTATHTNIDATAIAANASLSGAAVWWIDAQGDLAETFLEGGRAYLRVRDPFANGSSFSVDSVSVNLSVFLTGDSESLVLVETGDDTGVFEGSIELQTDQYGSASSGNNILETGESQGPPFEYDTLTAIYYSADPNVQPTATAQTTGSRTWLVDANGAPTSVYAIGSTLHVRVEDQNYNYELGLDYVDVEIISLASGDSELLMLQETSQESGVFAGTLQIVDGGGSSTPSDGLLQAQAGETLEARHPDLLGYTQSIAQATIAAVSVEIIDGNGAPAVDVVSGDTLHLRVFSLYDDLDSGVADSVSVDVSTLYGADLESVMLTETGASTSVFEGSIRLAGSAGSGPGFLETATSGLPLELPDVITASYNGVSDQATVIASRIWLLGADGEPATTYANGETVTVRVLDQDRNDPGTVDSINVQLEILGSSSDNESLSLGETGVDTGVFEGTMVLDPSSFGAGDGLLGAQPGDTVRATHTNVDSSTTSAQATVAPAAIWWIDASGEVTDRFIEGGLAYLRVRDAAASGSVWVDLGSISAGDSESVELPGTAEPGLFEGSILLRSELAFSGNGTLETSPGSDTFQATYFDYSTNAPISVQASTTGGGVAFTDASGQVATSYLVGDTVHVELLNPNSNQATESIDLAQVTLDAVLSGDSEIVDLLETGPSTGVFRGSLPLRSDSGGTGYDNGLLEVSLDDTLTVLHTDPLTSAEVSAQAGVAGHRVLFLDIDGNPTDALLENDLARVRVITNAVSNPAVRNSLTVDFDTANAGDGEFLSLQETGLDTDVFEGMIRLDADNPAFPDGFLQTSNYAPGGQSDVYDQVTVTYKAPSGNVTATATAYTARIEIVDAGDRPIDVLAAGEALRVRLEKPRSAGYGMEYIDVTTQPGGDSEMVQADEIGSTGVFVGTLPTGVLLGATPSDGQLNLEAGDTITAANQLGVILNTVSDSVAAATSLVRFVDPNGDAVSAFLNGSTAYLEVIDGGANWSQTTVQDVFVDLSSVDAGDLESVQLTETGVDTGVFRGSIDLADTGFANSFNGVLETVSSSGPAVYQYDRLEADYTDAALLLVEASATLTGPTVELLDANGVSVDGYALGETLHLRAEDHLYDTPGVVDNVLVILDGLGGGDNETATLLETGTDTGVYEGSIASAGGVATFGDGILQVSEGETVRARFMGFYGTLETVEDIAVIAEGRLDVIDIDGNVVNEMLEGDFAYFRLTSQSANLDPGVAETVTVTAWPTFTSGTEDRILTETDVDSGVFEGKILTALYPGLFNNGLLEVWHGGAPFYPTDTITVAYGDLTATAKMVRAEIEFLDLSGQPRTSFAQEEALRIRVNAQNENYRGIQDTLTVDFEIFENGVSQSITSIVLDETDPLSGIFEGVVSPMAFEGSVLRVIVQHPETPMTTTADAVVTSAFAPFLMADAVTVEVDTATVVDPLANDQDPGLLTLVSVSQGTLGATATNGDGTFTYTPNPGVSGVDAVTYIAQAADGAQAQETVTVTINAAPTVTITAPADGAVLTQGDTATFTGTASDVEDGDLVASIAWSSDVDGALGTGASVASSALSVGAHVVTASVVDSQGATAETAVNLTINAPPTVAITAPADGATFSEGDSVGLTGTAGDTEDGDLGATIAWTSDVDGALGTGISASATLTPGAHVLTASVVDSQGVAASDTVSVTVNAAPSLAITAPADGSVALQGDTMTFTATASDTEDGDLGASIAWTSDLDGPLGTGILVSSTTLSLGTHTVTAQVTDSGGIVAQQTVTVTINAAPTVAITAPADGTSVLEQSLVTLTGTSSDTEDGDLTASIAWTSSLDGALGTGASVATSSLSIGTHTITASVTDSLGATDSATINLTINANTAPTVSITSPATGTSVLEQSLVTLTGTSSDTEDGDLTASIAWTSSLDGALGTGASVATSSLSIGTHTITASVTDSLGATDSATINLTINANTAPTVSITLPANGNVSTETDPITFTATASDTEDGDLSASIGWTSSLDGALGTGGGFVTGALSPGTHVITASVSDSLGAPGQAQITVTVNANTAPSATITAPLDGDRFTLGDNVTFTGTASDTQDGDLSSAISWNSSRDGALGTGGSISTAGLTLGAHSITATVIDSHGAQASAVISITIRPQPVQVSFGSVETESGFILEQDENSNVGGTKPNDSGTYTLILGDDRKDEQYRSVLSFDTASIPDGAEIQAVTLRLRRASLNGTNPFNILGACRVDVRTGALGGSTAFQPSDFEAATDVVSTTTLSTANADLDWSEGTFNGAGLAALNVSGRTQLRVYFETDDNDDRRQDYLQYFSAAASNPADRPELVVTYQE